MSIMLQKVRHAEKQCMLLVCGKCAAYVILPGHIVVPTCRYGTGQVPSPSKLLCDHTVRTPLSPLWDHFTSEYYETSRGPTTGSNGKRTVLHGMEQL